MRIAPALLFAFALTGCMAMPEPEPVVETRELAVPSGGAVELDFEMKEGDEIEVTIVAEKNVSWDIHSHPEEALMTWRHGEASAMDVTFTAPVDDVYSVMLVGAGNASRATVTLRGAFSIVP